MQRPKLPKFKTALPWLAGAVLIAGATAYLTHHEEPSTAEAAVSRPARSTDRLKLPAGASQLAYIQTLSAAAQPLPLTDPLNARIALAEDHTARVFAPVAGRIVALAAQPGDQVAAGGVLATLDAPDLGQAMADLRKAEADAARKHQALERARTLLAGEVLPRREFEAAEADARAANAEAERARLRVANLTPSSKVDGERLSLRSPVAGTVIERQANPGLEVRPDAQNPLFVVSDLSQLWLLIDLPEKDLGRLKVGETVTVKVDAFPDESFSAKVERIAPALDATTRRVQVRCLLPNGDGRLRPEMFARAALASPGGEQAIRLPLAALLSDGLYTSVFLSPAPGEFVKRRVKVLRQDAEYAYVPNGAADGLKPGEQVVVKGALLLNAELGAGD